MTTDSKAHVGYVVAAKHGRGGELHVCLRCAVVGADDDMTVTPIEVTPDAGPLDCELCGATIQPAIEESR